MTKQEMVALIQMQADLESKAKAEEVYTQIISLITAELAAGESVVLRGFGSFSVSERAARAGRNPRTGEAITIPAQKTVKFAPGQDLKAAAEALEKGEGQEWLSRMGFLKNMEGQLGELRKRLGDVRQRSEKLSQDARETVKEHSAKAGAMMEEARYKLKLLKGGSESAWQEVKKGLESAYDDLKAAFQRAREKF